MAQERIRWVRSLAVATVAAAVAGVVSAQSGNSPDMKKARESVAWLNNFACPVPGRHMVVGGLETPAQVEALRSSNWAFAQTMLERLTEASTQYNAFIQLVSQRKLNSKDEAAIERLTNDAVDAAARVATGLVNWSLANFVEISKTNPDFDSGSRQEHPLKGHLQQAQALQQYVARIDALVPPPETMDLLKPIEKKFWTCLQAAQVSVIESSAGSIRKARSAATSSAEIDRIVSSYVLIGNPAPTSPLLTELATAKSELLAVEQLAAEEREKLRQEQLAQQARERAKIEAERQAEERERNAKRVALATANLPVAKKLVMALDSGLVADAGAVMDDDISLTIPGMSTTYGRSSVLQLMNRGSGSQGGSIDAPQVNSRGDIVASGVGSRGRFQLYIDVSGGLVTAMRIVR